MMTLREQIMRAVVAALNSPDKPAGVPACTRARALGAAEPDLPYLAVYPIQETTERHNNGPVAKRAFAFRVHCKTSTTVADDEPVDAAADASLAWAVKALAGNRLGGLVHDITEDNIEWSLAVADYAYVDATLDFTARYQTLVSDPTRSV